MNANGYAQTYEGLHHFEHSSTRDNRASRTSLIAANGSYSDTIRDCFLPTVTIIATRR